MARGAGRLWTGLKNEVATIIKWGAGMATDLGDALTKDLTNLWVSIGEGLKTLVNKLGAALRALPGEIFGYLNGPHGGGVAPIPPIDNPMLRSNTAYDPNGRYNGPRSQRPAVHIENVLAVDGEVLYRATSRYREQEMRRPNSGASTADGRLGILYQYQAA